MIFLKQSTAVTVMIGPFIDDTDGKTAEVALTLAQADIRISKNAANTIPKSEATTCTHDELGHYTCPLDTTDTNTLGHLRLMVHQAGSLPVWHDYLVVTANIYDSLFSTDILQADLIQMGGVAQSGTDLKDFADTGYDPVAHAVAAVSGAVGSVTGAVGSVTGAVGSVTGAVGSVTGAVGSVTGNVGGNVIGSVGTLTGLTAASAGKLDDILDGTGAVLYLSQLSIQSAAAGGAIDIDNSAGPGVSSVSTSTYGIYAKGNAAYAGLYAEGGVTGHGAYFKGGSTSGNGLYAYAPTSGSGISALGTGAATGGLYMANSSGWAFVCAGALGDVDADIADNVSLILADTGTDGVVVAAASKTGYALSATGLDTVATTAPAGVASNFREMLVQVWRRLFKKSTLTATQLKTYADNGTDVLTTQAVSDDATTQTQGASA
uniref:Uncharacterized protein n=1 Tax=viral metagenome TaxID=1070528 RepID=A0A6M3L7Q7_9ZZZZ